MRRGIFAFWLAVLTALHAAPAFAAPSAARKDAIFARQAEAIAEGEHIVGLAVAVVRDGKPVLIRAFGPLELDGTEPVDPHTIFRMGSLSKGFTASLVAQLVAEGKLELDARAAPYAPDFRLKNRRQLDRVTLENVMSHRLGLPPNAYDNLLEDGLQPGSILQRLGEVDPVCRVGDCYAYQNVAFNILGNVVESADGRPLGQAMAARLFRPLGMETASVGPEGLRSTGNWARPHRRRKGESWRMVQVRPNWYRLPAAAGVNASITDMARWLAAQMGYAPEVLSPEMLAMLHQPRVDTPAQARRIKDYLTVDSARYGLGWRIYQYHGETVIAHTGSVDGYSAEIAFLPARKAGIVALTNSRSAAFYTVMPLWLNRELGIEIPRPDPCAQTGNAPQEGAACAKASAPEQSG